MSNNTKIEWADATWNPITGCSKISEGCEHCYAERMVKRFPNIYPNGFKPTSPSEPSPESWICATGFFLPERITGRRD